MRRVPPPAEPESGYTEVIAGVIEVVRLLIAFPTPGMLIDMPMVPGRMSLTLHIKRIDLPALSEEAASYVCTLLHGWPPKRTVGV